MRRCRYTLKELELKFVFFIKDSTETGPSLSKERTISCCFGENSENTFS